MPFFTNSEFIWNVSLHTVASHVKKTGISAIYYYYYLRAACNDSKPAAARKSQSEVEDNDYEDLSDDDHLYDMPKTAEVDAEEEHIYENSP